VHPRRGPTHPPGRNPGGANGVTATATGPIGDYFPELATARHSGRLQAELVRLGRYPLLVVDEVGYIPFEPEAANLFFQLVSSRYERASLIVTSNKPFGQSAHVRASMCKAAPKHHGFAGASDPPRRRCWW
jgi:hypothetical protein